MASANGEGEIAIRYGGIVLGAIASAMAAIGGWLFRRVIRKHDEEIAAIQAGIKEVSDKVDGKVDRAVWEQNRRESRENIIGLHDKIEQIGRDSEVRHRELMRILIEQRSQRRAGD
jgi:hypothetical protein